MRNHIIALEGIPAYFSSPPSSNNVQLVDVTASHLVQIQELVDKSCLPTLGTGKDQKYRQDKYDKLVVTKVTRIENQRLFTRYTAQKNFMKKSCGQSAPLPHPLQSENNWTATQGLDTIVNESYLFHGTNPNYLQSIATHGFDERLSGRDSMDMESTLQKIVPNLINTASLPLSRLGSAVFRFSSRRTDFK
jgi:hypothetical protein